MSLIAWWVSRRDANLQTGIDAAFGRAPLAPEPERDQLLAATRRIWAAEDATRAMTTRLDAALERTRLANTARDQAVAENVQLRDQVRELGSEVAALRHLRDRAQAPRGTDRLCPECHNPMSSGMAHYCPRKSEYTEGVAA